MKYAIEIVPFGEMGEPHNILHQAQAAIAAQATAGAVAHPGIPGPSQPGTGDLCSWIERLESLFGLRSSVDEMLKRGQARLIG